MAPRTVVTSAVFEASLRCETKASLLLEGADAGHASETEARWRALAERFEASASDRLRRSVPEGELHEGLPSLSALKRGLYRVVIDPLVEVPGLSARPHALEASAFGPCDGRCDLLPGPLRSRREGDELRQAVGGVRRPRGGPPDGQHAPGRRDHPRLGLQGDEISAPEAPGRREVGRRPDRRAERRRLAPAAGPQQALPGVHVPIALPPDRDREGRPQPPRHHEGAGAQEAEREGYLHRPPAFLHLPSTAVLRAHRLPEPETRACPQGPRDQAKSCPRARDAAL